MDNKYMDMAIEQAKKAFEIDEVPVGAVIVKDDLVIAKAYNLKESEGLVTSHAEILAIIESEKKLNNWRLEDCDIYITLAPCPMCASAIKQARIKNVYCGLENTSKKNNLIVEKIFEGDETNRAVNYLTNLRSDEIKTLMSRFFSKRR